MSYASNAQCIGSPYKIIAYAGIGRIRFLVPMMEMDSIGDLKEKVSGAANFLINCRGAGLFTVRLSVTNSNCSEKNTGIIIRRLSR
jgi:hypothetical protein